MELESKWWNSVTNTDGTITSTVQANVNAGFSIVLYSGTGATATVGHGLGVAPKTIFVKGRTNTDHWFVYNKNLSNPTTGYVYWNQNSAETTGANPWGGNAATSSVFTIAMTVVSVVVATIMWHIALLKLRDIVSLTDTTAMETTTVLTFT